ncbi:MAG: acetylornithine transaminase [Actinomycetota bacterium]
MTNPESPDPIMATYLRWPVEFVEGHGATLTDARGRNYVDLMAGIAVASVGHAHPHVAEAVAQQASTLVHVSNLYGTRPQRELALRLQELTAGMVSFFCNSGAEAIECALKLARVWASAHKDDHAYRVVAADGSFHGRTFGALAATGQPAKQRPFAPMLEGFTHVPYGDAGALDAAVDDGVAAVLLEPIQGEAGVVVPPDDYLATARRLCDERGCLLVLDEIQTGLARTGAWFAHQHHGIVPDVMCLAKALAGGLPMGACLARPDVAQAFSAGDHASTFGGGPVQSAAAIAALEVIDKEGLVERAATLGPPMLRSLGSVFGEHGRPRGKGLLIGVELDRPLAREVAERALEGGVLVNDATKHVVRICPPLVITEEEWERALGVLEEVWGEIGAA